MALIVTAIGTFFEVRSRVLKAELQIISADRLTQTRDIPGLEANFTFKGSLTKELWKLKVQLLNSGDLTIVGKGNKKNIVGDFITIAFPNDVSVFEPQKEFDNFPHNLQIVKDSSNEFLLEFTQWRSGEYGSYSFYISSDIERKEAPTPAFPKRDIIDGDLLVRDLALPVTQKKPYIDKFPKPFAIAGKILGIVGVLLVTGALIFGTFSMAKDSFPWFRWRYRYYDQFLLYLEHIDIEQYISGYIPDGTSPSETNKLKQEIIKGPWRRYLISNDEQFWSGFAGPPCPDTYPAWKNWASVLFWLVILTVSLCACFALVASVIVV